MSQNVGRRGELEGVNGGKRGTEVILSTIKNYKKNVGI